MVSVLGGLDFSPVGTPIYCAACVRWGGVVVPGLTGGPGGRYIVPSRKVLPLGDGGMAKILREVLSRGGRCTQVPVEIWPGVTH